MRGTIIRSDLQMENQSGTHFIWFLVIFLRCWKVFCLHFQVKNSLKQWDALSWTCIFSFHCLQKAYIALIAHFGDGTLSTQHVLHNQLLFALSSYLRGHCLNKAVVGTFSISRYTKTSNTYYIFLFPSLYYARSQLKPHQDVVTSRSIDGASCLFSSTLKGRKSSSENGR